MTNGSDKIGKKMIYSPGLVRRRFITKVAANGRTEHAVLDSVEAEARPVPPEGAIGDPNLYLEVGEDGEKYKIEWVDDGAIIQTTGRIDPGGTMGPGCTWYYWGGRFWRICD